MREEEFYVGYLPHAPAGVSRWLRRTVTGLLLLAAALGALLVLAQMPFAAASFEYGVTREFSGVLYEHPFPHVVTTDGHSYLLAGAGKRGSKETSGHDRRQVHLRGSRVLRAGMTLIEVETGSLQFGAKQSPEHVVMLGNRTLQGEIVDGKCYLGVMNPGAGQVHRDCAARCLAGGLPPLFIAGKKVLVLAGFDARNNMDKVGVPLTLEGTLKKVGGLEVLELTAR